MENRGKNWISFLMLDLAVCVCVHGEISDFLNPEFGRNSL